MLRNGLEPWHLLIVAIVVMVMFGSKKLPDTARALGKSMRILKSEAKAMKEDGVASREPSGVTLSSEPDSSGAQSPTAFDAQQATSAQQAADSPRVEGHLAADGAA
ncbi:Sec-independent protein translocase subunit TatA [Streptomyces sp. NBC_00859]|uniref:Sec-independent protein translocase subunit TatA n=1 Tax=Streptomyces sp. NBC_00859 TaxID=2903682 RepID=UPI003865D549|nr:Sec-independent protein translocase subunit TatA [Streptomyces sp. NBC_00859]